MANILQIVQDVADRVGLVRPTALVGVSDNQARQLLAFANQEGHDLARRCAWQALTKEKTFTTVAQESQTGAVPADFDRFVTGTFYNRTKSRVVTGPLTAQEWADYKGRLASVVFDAFRLRGDAILLAPTPSAGETMVYEYVSKYWCGDASDTTPTQSAIEEDSDTVYLDEEAVTQGILWRFKKSRGLEFAQDFTSYETLVAQLMGRDGGARTLMMGSSGPFRPYPPQPPDGNWNIS